MKKVVKTKAFKDRLKGHRDAVITLFSPSGADSAKLLSASKDGSIRGINSILYQYSNIILIKYRQYFLLFFIIYFKVGI